MVVSTPCYRWGHWGPGASADGEQGRPCSLLCAVSPWPRPSSGDAPAWVKGTAWLVAWRRSWGDFPAPHPSPAFVWSPLSSPQGTCLPGVPGRKQNECAWKRAREGGLPLLLQCAPHGLAALRCRGLASGNRLPDWKDESIDICHATREQGKVPITMLEMVVMLGCWWWGWGWSHQRALREPALG